MTVVNRYSAGHEVTRALFDHQASDIVASLRFHGIVDTYTFIAEEGSGSGGVQVEFPPLLEGQVIVWPRLCSVRISDVDASTVMAIGHRAYHTSVREDPTTGIVNSLGVLVAENLAAFATGVDVATGPIANSWAALTGAVLIEPTYFDAQDGLKIVVTFTVGNVNVNDVLTVGIVYNHIN